MGLSVGTGLSQPKGGAPFGTGTEIGTGTGSLLGSQLKLGLRGLVPTWFLPPHDCPNLDWESSGLSQLIMGLLGSVPTHFGTAFVLGLFGCTTITLIR